ncbi:hypothetical protein FPHYL_11144 [Fusarium phyllophilum]|uniref:Uncharacterized protein n=1 Tax=Fusarium phyllophilum TaxID=47803 RepID=A0A8H5IX85_9HYPO|nr:hypothetical protein FPHYL_11144 [Fusarium phyllophilum]
MATKVITIYSAAIRVSIGRHISLLAAAVATLMLETTVLPASLRAAGVRVFGVLHASIIIIGTIILVASTFTSKILLTDLKNVNIAGPMQIRLLEVGLGPNTTLSANGVLHYRSSPSTNWRFGAMKSGDVTPTAEIADTGNTYRALMPYIEEKSRTTLERPGMTNMEGRWTTASLKNGTEVFSATLCFVAYNVLELYEITMTGMTIPSEPIAERHFEE